MLGTEIRVVDEDGEDVPADNETIGEIVVRGNQVMEGYWNKPEETEEAFSARAEGWFHTGDLATDDEDGMLRITDRKKDIIVSGGENISSKERLADYKAVRRVEFVAGLPKTSTGKIEKYELRDSEWEGHDGRVGEG
ncbi:MAG: AMP-binding protein [Haloarculaceae archaeon]